jgi:galactokinase
MSSSVQLFVPGRLCLFGEHSDWAALYGLHEGQCLVTGTSQGVYATAAASDRFQMSNPTTVGTQDHLDCPFTEEAITEIARTPGHYYRYCAGVAMVIRERYPQVGGVRLQVTDITLPIGKGLSSSAAISVLVARAFSEVYELSLTPRDLMEIAYFGERQAGSQCGRMDQVCAYGEITSMLRFTTDGLGCDPEPVPSPKKIHLLIIDLAGYKDTVAILNELHAAYPASKALQQALGPRNQQIVADARRLITAGDAEQLGRLMTEAEQLFERDITPYAPKPLHSPRLYALLACPSLQPHIYGGKGVGSHGDGTAQLVVRDADHLQQAQQVIAREFPDMRVLPHRV